MSGEAAPRTAATARRTEPLTHPAPSPARAEDRLLRVLALGFLPAGLLFGLLALAPIAAQWRYFPSAWSLAVLAGVVGAALVMGCLAFTAPLPVLRALAAVSAVSATLGQATAPLVVTGWPDPEQAPWIQQLMSLGAIASAIVWRPSTSLGVATVVATFTGIDRVVLDGVDDLLIGVQDALYVLLFSTTFIALAAGVLAGARRTDAAEREASRAAIAAAAREAEERERVRVNALVHDRVLGTLLAAARGGPESRPLVQADAARALDGLRALLGPAPPRGDPEGEQIAFALQAATTELVPDAAFGYEVSAPLAVPADALEALLAALEEALRNSLLHSGAHNRAVHVVVGPEEVRVDALDDGRGFDPARIPAGRLGIAGSITQRMQSLPGGSAQVLSAPGTGTRVVLRYRPEGRR